MNTKTLSLTLLLTISFLLMLTASYLSNVQNWLKFNQNSEQTYLNQSISLIGMPNGLRIISSDSVQSNNSPPPSNPSSKNDTLVDNSVSMFEHVPPVVANFSTERGLSSIHKGGEKNNHNLLMPSFIQYPDALVLEVPKTLATPSNLKRMVYRVLLSPSMVHNEALLSSEPVKTRHKPWFYKQVVNQYGQPIRYPAAALAYANYLLQHHSQTVKDEEGEFVLIQIPRVEHNLLANVERYKRWVDEYSHQFNVPKDLVFAIIEVESAFNPRAVSKSNALGLMQIKANAAGRDVYQYVDGRAGQPSPESLFDAQNNLRMGIAYMGLLKHDYLLGVRNPKIKEMLSISSYNAGISRTLKLFAPTPEEAISRVNQLHPKRVYRTLRYEHASSEARQYLDKVLKAKARYSELLDLNV